MSKTLELRLLGRLELQREGVPLTDIQANKTLALLSYLAVTGRSHTRPALAGLLWGGMPEAKARGNLSKALSTLRRVVGQYLIITRQTVTFKSDGDFWLDVAEFEAGANDNSIERLQEAVRLYEGDFLDGFYVRNALEFEDWVLAQRARLKEMALQAWHTLAAHFAGQGEVGRATAIEYTTRLLALELWREEAHRQMMRLLALNGQRGAALAQYESCRQVLANELGVEPGPETTALYEQIRDGKLGRKVRDQPPPSDGAGEVTPGSTRLPQHNLPPDLTPFVGRKQELEQLGRLLADDNIQLISIVGLGGMGKTRLALQAAVKALDFFADGVCFVRLAPLNSHKFLIATIAEALNLSFHGAAEPQAQVMDYLQNKKCLLILDNFEHILAGAGLLSQIVMTAPGVKLLVTSRERLNLQEEWVYDLQGMTFPETAPGQTSKVSKTFEVLENDYSALQLFEQRAGQVQAAFDLAAEYPAVVRICQLVEGMPLGLELAASWINLMSCREIAVEIEQNLDFLTTSMRNVRERHRSLRAVFEHSWKLLAGEEKEVFKKLSVFRGGFTRPAAENISGATLHTLMALVNKSLIQPDFTGRYHIHELLRQFGAEKLADAGETEQVRDRHLNFFLGLAEEAEPQLEGPDQVTWLKRLEIEYDNLRAALVWSRTAEDAAELGLRLAGSLAMFWKGRSYMSEGREHLSAALSRPDAAQRTAARAKALFAVGPLAFEQGDFAVVRTLLEESLSIYRELGPAGRLGVANTLLMLAVTEEEVGDYTTELSLVEEALGIMRTLEERRGTAWALYRLGWYALRQGNYEQAGQYFEEALPLCRYVGDKENLTFVLSGLGEIALRQGDYERAMALLEESLAIRREVGYTWGVAATLGTLGWVALGRSDLKQAETLLRESLTLRYEIADRAGGLAWCLEKLAEIALTIGQSQPAPRGDADFQGAARLFGAAEALRESIGAVIDLADQSEYARQVAIVRTQLDETVFAAAWAEGRAMTQEQAVEYALAVELIS